MCISVWILWFKRMHWKWPFYWCFHGLKSLGHDHISSNEELAKALVVRFDRKEPGLPFKELAQLKQIGTPKAYILEFQNILVMVSNISMASLVLLYTEGFIEPLKGLVISHKPTTLKDAINLTRDLHNVFPKTRYPPKPIFPSKFKEGRKPWK